MGIIDQVSGVGKTMDVSLKNLNDVLEPKWAQFGKRKNIETFTKVSGMINNQSLRQISNIQ